MEVLYGAVLFICVAAFVLRPLLRAAEPEDGGEDSAVAELEVRKEAKYREIRDAELDHAAGKLDQADFEQQDAELRAEAIEILKELDAVKKPGAG